MDLKSVVPTQGVSLGHTLGDRRGQDGAAVGSFGRFGRLFPDLEGPVFPDDLLRDVAQTIVSTDAGQQFPTPDDDENKELPAGYTYFGQFIDHDLTFDTTGPQEKEIDPDAVENFRSPAFDLDSLFGLGPAIQPYLYEPGGMRLAGGERVGPVPPSIAGGGRHPIRPGSAKVAVEVDHPRFDGRALIGDPRNDENLVVAQLHRAFAAFYNKVVDGLPAVLSVDEKRRTARTITRYHYQWVVRHDYLPRILHPSVVAELDRYPRIYKASAAEWPFLPLEFSAAAYRFGHSQVRPSYALNTGAVTSTGNADNSHGIPIFVGGIDPKNNSDDVFRDLQGFRPYPGFWGVDWSFFLDGVPAPDGVTDRLPQPSYRIDTSLASGLGDLPDHAGLMPSEFRSLAFLNLRRGSLLRLPSAEQLKGYVPLPSQFDSTSPLLDWDRIWNVGSKDDDGEFRDQEEQQELAARRKEVGARIKALIGEHTPLWYYVLREAEWYGVRNGSTGIDRKRGGHFLGPLASVIIAETFLGLMARDPASFLHVPGWRPDPAIAEDGLLTLGRLVTWALT